MHGRYISKNDTDYIKLLGMVSQLRGLDSAGIATAQLGYGFDSPIYNLLVDDCNFTTLLQSKEYDQLMDEHGLRLIMGHNRAATLGVVNKENAHPYHIGDLIGAHNGTIYSLAPSKKEEKNNTDSSTLFYLLDEALKNGETFQDVRDEYLRNGDAYALTWINTKDNTFNMVRNSARTLYTMKSRNLNNHQGSFVYASEPSFLKLLDEKTNILWDDPVALPTNVIHTWKIGEPCKAECVELPSQSEVYTFGNSFSKKTSDPKHKVIEGAKEEPQKLLPHQVPNTDLVSNDNLKKDTPSSPRQTLVYDKTTEQLVPKSAHHGRETSNAIRVEYPHVVCPNIAAEHSFPSSTTFKGERHVLRYRGWEGKFYKIADIKKVLKEGDVLHQRKANVRTPIHWVDKELFIRSENIQDDWIKATFKSMYKGSLVYVNEADLKGKEE